MPTNLFIPYGMRYVMNIPMLFSALSTQAQSPPLVKNESNTTYKNAYLFDQYSADKEGDTVFQSPDGLTYAAYVDRLIQVDGKQCSVFMIPPTNAINSHWT